MYQGKDVRARGLRWAVCVALLKDTAEALSLFRFVSSFLIFVKTAESTFTSSYSNMKRLDSFAKVFMQTKQRM